MTPKVIEKDQFMFLALNTIYPVQIIEPGEIVKFRFMDGRESQASANLLHHDFKSAIHALTMQWSIKAPNYQWENFFRLRFQIDFQPGLKEHAEALQETLRSFIDGEEIEHE